MSPTEFEVDDAIVLILGAPTQQPALKDRLEGITRLEKLVFLLQRETELGQLLTEDPEFHAHHFGPFSSKIYEAVEVLKAALLLEETGRISGASDDAWEAQQFLLGRDAEYTTRDFSLTQKGRSYYEALVSVLPKGAIQVASHLKDQYGSLPLRQLIRYVYQRYPSLAAESKIRDQVLGQ